MNDCRYSPVVACCCALVVLVLNCGNVFAQEDDPFRSLVRPTPHLSPEEAQRTFQLPPGFQIQLVAAEPDILKPLNMAFDARGRLWVTVTQEYPYAAPPDRKPQDALMILEDRDGDGRCEKITQFADELNIPIGVYPFRNGAIVFSIPHIWYLEDTDGDDVADRRTQLYGPMGYERDTHGMNNAFRRGFDGWLYACHGFNNETRVRGQDGHEVHMQSGNTYRMRLDGSRIEQFTWGQVNPFGMAFDSQFNIFTADCHSKPLTMLLRGAYYPSFGKPHDGLGFAPSLMDHLHDSTAIAGVACYEADQFPEEYRGNLFSGNVMTSRINRNALVLRGATAQCREEEDFVKCSDPWFRPVDVCVGPDGALYIADFYNRIIGHYEVALEHPGRDRTSGRIWRVVYVGDQDQAPTTPPTDFSQADTGTLVTELASGNLTRRMLASDQLADRIGQAAIPALRNVLYDSTSSVARAHALWVLHRLQAIRSDDIVMAAVDEDRQLRVHAMKVLSELPEWDEKLVGCARIGLVNDPPVVLAAADAWATHVDIDGSRDLLMTLSLMPQDDTMLRHALRIALRNHLQVPGRLTAAWTRTKSDAVQWSELPSIAVAIPSSEAATTLIDYLKHHAASAEQTATYLQHAAVHAAGPDLDVLIELVRSRFAEDIDFQRTLLPAIHQGLRQRGAEPPATLVAWATELARQLLTGDASEAAAWTFLPMTGGGSSTNPWVLQQRPSSDGTQNAFLCSLPRGEQLTGILRSAEFEIPPQFTFYLAGHSGFPDKPLSPKNFVQLCDAATGQSLIRTSPPRNDTAQQVQWDLSAWTGKRGYLEIVDGDTARAYAWLAAGRFQPEVVAMPALSPSVGSERQRAALDIIAALRLESLLPDVQRLLERSEVEAGVAASAARAQLAFAPDARGQALAAALDHGLPTDLARQTRHVIVRQEPTQYEETLSLVMQHAPAALQQSMATALAGDAAGAETLVRLVEQGRGSPRLLQFGAVAQRLQTLERAELAERIAALTSALPPVKDELDQLIAQRRNQFAQVSPDLENGAQVFTRACAACHQIAGKGAMVGPQLDGIGNRGLDRLLEDLLDPSRNVDVAFRSSVISLHSGQVVTGLQRGERGELLVLFDDKGKEFTVPKSDVDERAVSPLSLMPENASSALPPAEFYDLLAYLLAQRAAEPQH